MRKDNTEDWLFRMCFKLLMLWLSCHVFVMVNAHYNTDGKGWMFFIPIVAFTYATIIQLKNRHFIV
jgi:hypothetical protein